MGRPSNQAGPLADLLIRIGVCIACFVLLLLMLSVNLGGCFLLLQVFAMIAFPVTVGVILAPALGGLLANPFGWIFHPGGRSAGSSPGLSVAEAMRIQGDGRGAWERLRETVAEHPQELGAYTALVRIALLDLDEPDLARDALSLGLRALTRQEDRDRLAREYREAGAAARSRSHASTGQTPSSTVPHDSDSQDPGAIEL